MTIFLASPGCSSSQVMSWSLTVVSTNERISVLPSFVLVWPSNWGSRSFTDDDRGQALADVLADEVVLLLLEQALAARVPVDTFVSAFLKPSSCMPPS